MEIERSIKPILIDYEQGLSLVQKAFPHCRKLDKWQLLSGGALNTIYQFQIDSDPFVLRIYSRDRAHCKMEEAIHHLIDGHVTTPKLIYANSLHEPWAYSIYEFISGVHLTEVAIDHKKSLSFQLGTLLAKIHSFRFSKAGLFTDRMTIGIPFEIGSSPYFEETERVLTKSQIVQNRLGKNLNDRLLVFIQKNREFFPIISPDNICLTHSDFKPVNLLYDTNGKVYVLDWEFAHAGNALLDLAILLRHRNQFPFDLESLQNGYTSFGGRLPTDWFRSALITDFVNMVTLIEQPGERPLLFKQLKEIMESTMESWYSN